MKNIFKRKSKTVLSGNTNLILVDVDDTISPSQYKGESTQYCSDWNGCHDIPDELFEDIESLPGDKVWLTSWTGDAEDTFKRGWRFLEWDDAELYYEWKLNSLNRFLHENAQYTKVVWLDNDMKYWEKDIDREGGVEYLLISPDNYKGISPDDVEEARKFLKG